MFFRVLIVAVCLPVAALAEDWSGAYWGGGLTYAIGEAEVVGNRFAYDINAAETRVPHDLESLGLTAFMGWNERRNNLVFGAELRITGNDLSSDVFIQGGRAIDEVSMPWRTDLVGRFGYVTGSTLIFVGGGVSLARISNLGGDIDGGALDLADAHMRDDTRLGATFMAGIETRVVSNWILRGEFSHTDFQSYREANQQGAPGSQFYIIDNGPIQTVTLGIVFEF